MADVQEAQATTTKAIEDYDLELSLAFRPLNSSPPRHHHHHHLQPKDLLEPTNGNVIVSPSTNSRVISKREEQSIRRHEAKVKRDLKRKVAALNGVAISEEDEEEGGLEKRSRTVNFGIQRSFSCGNAGGFRPYQGPNRKFSRGTGVDGGGGDGETRSSISTGSSSGVSDNNNYNSNSAPGGNSSDTSSHSSHPHSHVAAPSMPTASPSETQPYSSPQEAHLTNNSNSNLSQLQSYSSPTSLENTASRETLSKDRSSPDKKPPLPASRSSSPKEAGKGVIGKPPKPNGQTRQQKGVLPQMPCVSATGNGPNGKTITGFLYKYTKTEVSIVCVCHGTSFTPAGFVEHAGGADVEHPLRHIRVVPFGLT